MNETLTYTGNRLLEAGKGWAVVLKLAGEICSASGDTDGEHSSTGLSIATVVRSELEAHFGSSLDYIEPVHRLDVPVTGCVLLALDRNAAAALSAAFASGKVRKTYWAIVEKKKDGSADFFSGKTGHLGSLEHQVRFDRKTRKASVQSLFAPSLPGDGWKKAVLDWKCIGQGERYTFLELEPRTGRTHQIRAQLSAVGTPIKGDLKYHSRRSETAGGIRLHGRSIAFSEPETRKEICVFAPVPVIDPLWQAFMEAGSAGKSGNAGVAGKSAGVDVVEKNVQK